MLESLHHRPQVPGQPGPIEIGTQVASGNNKGSRVTFNRMELFQRGLFLQRMTPPGKLAQLIQSISPHRTQFDLLRIGSEGDGGYLVPDDLSGITACFSPGVETNASFEADLLRRFGIGSHLADYSVPGPPAGFAAKSFIRKFLGASNDDTFITLDSWVESAPEFRSPGDFLLQMDIEGAEYATLLSASERNLRRFRILVIEFHNVENWSDPAFFEIAKSTFQKLLRDFMVIHNHPNNFCGVVNMGGVIAPHVFELTFLRRDRAVSLGPCDKFPHPLDRPNRSERPNLVLPENWYRSADVKAG